MWNPKRWFLRHVPLKDVPFVVPFESHQRVVGADYMQRLARRLQGEYQRDPDGIGLMDDMSVLSGPSFDPDALDHLVREFYEHTTRFRLSVRPKWHWIARPVFVRRLD